MTANPLFQKYATAIFSLLVLVLGAVQVALDAIQAALENGESPLPVVLQLLVVAGGGFATFIVPIVDGPWHGALKTGIAIFTTIVAAVIPYATVGHITYAQIVFVVIAGLNAAATELGVKIRKDDLALAA